MLTTDEKHTQAEFKRLDVQPEKPLNDSGILCCPSFLSCIGSILFPLPWIGACTTVKEREEVVVLNFGKYVTTIREPGCYCWNFCGLTQYHVYTSRVAVNLDNVKVADARGNPLLISGVVTYQISKARAAVLDVQDVRQYILNQGLAVAKKIASMYPYESQDGHSLKGEADRIREQMMAMLQERCNVAGVVIYNFELTDLAYAPEIAQAMLIRQQAEAMVDARKIIVKGAVEISHGAVESLAGRGVHLAPDEQTRLVSNLLVTICGDTKVQPVISVSSCRD